MMASFQLHNDTVVSTIGEILVELVSLDTGTGFLERQNLRGPFASGAPAIFIDQIARLGLPFSMAGAVGDDDFGRLNVERLKRDFLITLDVSAATQIDINCVQQ